MKKNKLSHISVFRFFLFGFILAINGVLATAFISVYRSPPLKPISNLGNWPENIGGLPKNEEADPYSFIVLGDSRNGIEIYETLLEKSTQLGQPIFGIHLGDFVPHSTAGQYAFFLHEFSEKPFFPMFIVPGNHDVNPKEDKGRNFFETTMGPRQCWFRFRNDLFIILDNAIRPVEESLNWLEKALSKEAVPSRNIFIFTHQPPFQIDSQTDRSFVDRESGFHRMLKKWGVTHVYSGHYHSYLQTKVDGIQYVITGGGGAPLYGNRGLYHVLLIDVLETQIQETVISTPYKFGLDDELANAAYNYFYDFFHNQPLWYLAIMALVQLLLLVGLWISFGWWKKKK